MPAWTAIFFDTCILEAEQFDFVSPRFEAVIAAVRGKKMQLLLPHVTEQEIERHIETKLDNTIAALRSIRKDHAFLRHMEGIPHTREERATTRGEIKQRIASQWRSFKKKFDLVKIGALESVASLANQEVLIKYFQVALSTPIRKKLMRFCEEPRTREQLMKEGGFNSKQALHNHLQHLREDLVHETHIEGEARFEWSLLFKRIPKLKREALLK